MDEAGRNKVTGKYREDWKVRSFAMSTTPENGAALPLRPALRSETEDPMSPKSGPVKGKTFSSDVGLTAWDQQPWDFE